MNYDLNGILSQLASDLDKRYKQLIAGNSAQIKNEYVSKLFRLNEWCEFRDMQGIFTGRILTIGDYGRIKINKKSGNTSEYNFKEVEFIL
jgi:BirA family biotin operon repressor/biotin-[acetyl-CoA-carboxylase] ligase